MKRRTAPLAAVLCVLWAVLAACQQPVEPGVADVESNPMAPGGSASTQQQFIVTLKPGASPEGIADAHGVAARFTYSKVLNGFAADLPEAALQALERHPHVERIEPDLVVTTQQEDQGKGGKGDGGSGVWGLDRIDQRPPEPLRSYSVPGTGAGVTAYIVDTGIYYDHQEFGGRGVPGFDFQRRGDGSDCHGHGTHVAGTVGGTTYGAAKAVALVSVRVLDCDGSGKVSGVIAGLDWIAKNAARPAVANMSLGGGFSQSLNDATENLIASGVPVAVAAGNSNRDACNFSPASAPSAMTVGATTNRDKRAIFSNWGACLDWFAPGVSIPSAWLGGGTNTISGTSMASPHAAGVAALYLENRPQASAAQVRDALLDFATKCVVEDAKSDHWHLLYALERSDPWNCGTPPVPDSNDLTAPTILSATASTTSISVTLEWHNPSFSLGADTYQLQWRKAGTSWSAEPQQQGPTSEWHTLTIGSGFLDGGTTYEFRVRTGIPTHDVWSDWSNVVSATTCAAKGGSGKCG
jgi:subtilisin family serine protease